MNDPGQLSTVWTWVQFLVWVGNFHHIHPVLVPSQSCIKWLPQDHSLKAKWSGQGAQVLQLRMHGAAIPQSSGMYATQSDESQPSAAANRTLPALYFMLVSCLVYSSTLKMETFSSKISAFTRLPNIISQKSRLFIASAVRASDSKYTSHPLSSSFHMLFKGLFIN